MDPYRAERVAETLRVELEEIINYELADPLIGDVSVAEVLISPDKRRVQVRVVPRGDPAEQSRSLEALERARGFVRRLLAERLQMFRIPDVRFEAALAPKLGSRSAFLMKKIRRGRPKDAPGPSAGGEKKSPQ